MQKVVGRHQKPVTPARGLCDARYVADWSRLTASRRFRAAADVAQALVVFDLRTFLGARRCLAGGVIAVGVLVEAYAQQRVGELVECLPCGGRVRQPDLVRQARHEATETFRRAGVIK